MIENTQSQEQEVPESSSEEKVVPKDLISQDRFDEVNNAYEALKTQLDEMKEVKKQVEKEKAAKEKEEAKKRGEFETLYQQSQVELENLKTEGNTARERVDVLERVINQLLDSKLELIDQEYHDLIPTLPPEQKLTWVTQAGKKGLFGNLPSKQTLGEQTNPAIQQEVSMTKMNPLQKILAGYSRK